ncbi:MAG TPA: hypothetical protein VJP79_09675 [Nitrososphaera sp.]|nr:hypothetical protein [Nitrososphaera sp.]
MKRTFSSVREYDRQSSSPKSCRTCSQPATKDVLFDVGNGVALVERYCSQCASSLSNDDHSYRSSA